jgi:hypothetical protein
MDEKPVDVSPVNALGILLPQHSFATSISGGSDTSRLFDLQMMWQRSSPKQFGIILGIQESLCKEAASSPLPQGAPESATAKVPKHPRFIREFATADPIVTNKNSLPSMAKKRSAYNYRGLSFPDRTLPK